MEYHDENDMQKNRNRNSPAVVISGVKLLYDFSLLNYHSLDIVLANMQFLLKKYLSEYYISLYVSEFYNEELSTLIFFDNDYKIKKVRYVEYKMEAFFYT